MVDLDAPLRVGKRITIPPAELEWRFSASGGPGGQHVNTSNTRVELVFDVMGSTSLGPRQRERLLERLGPRVRVVAMSHRSQARNRQEARERLAGLLSEGLKVEKSRVPTAPTPGSRQRRLREKRVRSERKAARSPTTRSGRDEDVP